MEIRLAMHASCYSARFVQPFADVLSTYENFPVRAVDELQAIDPMTRISLAVAHRIAARHVRQTGDLDLGLKAGRSMSLGRGGALDYAMYSAATMRDAIALAHRYGRLFSDSLHVHHKVDGPRATVFIDLGPATPRVVSDFAMSAWFMHHIRLALGSSPRLECSFSYSEPMNTTEYERTFGPATLHFNARCCAFSFDSQYLDAPLPTAEPIVHAASCAYVTLNRVQLRDSRTWVDELEAFEPRRGVPIRSARHAQPPTLLPRAEGLRPGACAEPHRRAKTTSLPFRPRDERHAPDPCRRRWPV
jgi:Arabinose-binding domain of AraC transcription regulator, N-term